MELKVEYVNIDTIKPYKRNAKTHPKEQVEQIKKSIQEFGNCDPIGVWHGEIVEGHGRYLALKELGETTIPIIRLDSLTDEQRRAYGLVHNQLTMNSPWDLPALDLELADLDFDMGEFGFGLLDDDYTKPDEVKEDDFDEEPPAEPKAKRGDIYLLGNHRLMCGDSTSAEDVAKLMDGAKADMVFTDPPYGMGKESEGVTNDNLNLDDLLAFNKKWIPLSFSSIKENGSWYCWGTDEPLMDIYSEILKPMKKRNEITFRNFITWKKESENPTMLYNGACSEGFRKYYSNEKCLFVMKGVQGFSNNADNYYEGWEPIRKYLADEAAKVNLTPKKLQEICGVGMFGHWFTKSQWTLIPEKYYKQLQKAFPSAFGGEYSAVKKDYQAFKKEYEKIKEEYYNTRAFFEAQPNNVDVWVYDVAPAEERTGHATPKPIALCTRAIQTSSKEGESVLDLFGGSGSTMIACSNINRKCYAMEIEPKWVDVIIARWEKFTGRKAEKI